MSDEFESYPGHWQAVLSSTNARAYNQALEDVVKAIEALAKPTNQ